jgi:ubiquitin carboxyl-terminal hydrolase 34
LTVKDTKSIQASLNALIEGETISDFMCDGCNKKVDISKRTLLSTLPNVLVVHLQRIIFDFNTFRNEKINTLFEFPKQLDLKPYSFYEVMKKENRLKKTTTDEEGEEKEEEDEDNVWPEEETCFEYKLVGIIMHSGSAQAGHYWSYINTKRGH